MTNKEAIEELKAKVNLAKELEDEEVNFISIEVLDLAIKALEERPKGEWVEVTKGIDSNTYECPFCGRLINCDRPRLKLYPFCHCGAKMKGDKM